MTLNEALDILEVNGFLVESPNLDLNKELNEDFSIGVGAPCGCDQGIPHGGDCKGVAPVRMGLYQRSPYSFNPYFNGVPDAHHPDYWLNQIPKKKKKKKRKKSQKV